MPITTKRAPKSVTPANQWIAAFKVGTHTDMSGVEVTFSEADISALASRVQSQISGGFTPPLVVGHPVHDSPRVGGVVDAKAEGGTLYLKVDELTPEFAEACRQGAYKYTSVSLYKDGGLRHLGVLGGANPAVKGLAPIAFGEGMFAEPDGLVEGPHAVLQFAAEVDFQSAVATSLQRLVWRIRSIGTTFRAMRESIIESAGVDAANKQIPDYVISDLETMELPEPSPVALAPSFSDPAPAPTPAPTVAVDPVVAPAEPPVSVEPGVPAPVPPTPATDPTGPGTGQTPRELELAAENDRLRQELRTKEVEQTRKVFSDRLDGLAQDGRLLPAQRTHLERLYKAIEASGHSFAEPGDLQASLDGLLASFPKQVDFGELPHGDPSIDPKGVASQISDLMSESERAGSPLSFVEATQKITNRRLQNGR